LDVLMLFRMAAAATIAVLRWSSWNTDFIARAASFLVKHSGALMSSS
jgi:hypothetical protein